MANDTKRYSRWEMPDDPGPYVYALLVLVSAVLVLAVYFRIITALIFIPASFSVIVFAGLWYRRKALWLALFFGIVLIIVTHPVAGAISPDSLFSAGMLFLVAFFTGTMAEHGNRYNNENIRISEQCKTLDEEKQMFKKELKTSQIARDTAGRKLRFLSALTHNDIFNNLSALIGSVDLVKTKISDPALLADIERSETIAYTIQRQIEFARTYESIGTSAPQWLNVDKQIHALLSSLPENEISFSISLDSLEIFADPLFEKVVANLISNSLIHGVRVSQISISHLPFNRDIAIVYMDNGIGIHAVDKARIFEKGVGKKPGFGLYLSREILSITGLSIKESGVYGEGARFEIFIPGGKFRFS